jgi:outer membrane beta-barrel protein
MMHDAGNPAEPVAWRRTSLAGAMAALLLVATWAAALAAPEPNLPPPAEPSFAAASDTMTIAEPDSMAPQMAPQTAPASPHARLTSTRKVRFDFQPRNVVRSGPGERFAISGVYPKGAEFVVIAKSGAWYNIRLSETETAWVHSSLCKEFEDLSDLEFKANPKLYSRTGTIVLSGYGGAYAFDRKSNSLVLGGRLGYYLFDRIQFEGGLSWTHVRRPAEIVETLFGLSLEAEDFHMLFYHLNATWELLPGRQMVPYLSAGVGSSIMQGETEPSLNFGAGTTLFVSKRVATRWEVRGFRFDSGADAARITNHNVEFALGTLMLF